MDKDYKNASWRHHGESFMGEQNIEIEEEGVGPSIETGDQLTGIHDVLNDVFVQPLTEEGIGPFTEPLSREGRPKEVETSFKMLKEADQDLWPGPRSPGKEIDVYMRPLIDELNELWEVGTSTYDAYSNQNFTMKAAVLWTISDFPAYGMLSGWNLEILNIRHGQHPRREGNRTFRPPALFTLKREEKTAFCEVLSTIRVPDGYSSNLSRCVHVNDRKIHGLKSHDCHVLMQQLLPLAIRAVLPKSVSMILLELSAIFRQLCSKKESKEGFKQLNSRIALTLCQLEKIFPPAFFDVMMHLPVHLAEEAAIAWPVPYRWMYPIERYLQTLKRYVRNMGYPEGSIAEAYLVDECLSFCSLYLRDVESRRTRRGRNEDGIGRGVSGRLSIFYSKGCYMGSGENVELELNVLDQCHRYILNNCDEMNSRCHANDNLISEDLRWLANYPSRVVTKYKSHIIHGFRFRTKSVDDKHKNQNCGVFVPANVPGAIGQVNCYGRVINMFEVRYCGPTEAGDRGRAVILFKCEWVNSESPRGMKTDQYGFTLVNFNRLGFKEDPFILASQALQAFYVEDTIEKDWHVVVRMQPRDLFDVLEDNDALDDYAIPDLDDRLLDNENLQTRVGVEETPFHEVLPLPTQFPEFVNAADDITEDEME
ncbi:uncharacterized protein [Malus domestica]|uniref:uncharacterized protein n=1 Tax=Malus domestica TaxID=3750 RepID=UPI003975CBE2